jgi:hypothetical protein
MKVLIVDGIRALQEYLLRSRNVHIRYVTCGRKNCRCKIGKRHGPYYYIRRKTVRGYKDIYVKPPTEPLSLKYEEIRSSLLLEIEDVENIPEFLRKCPAFIVNERVH